MNLLCFLCYLHSTHTHYDRPGRSNQESENRIMAFQGFKDSPGPLRPPETKIRFGAISTPPSASKTSSRLPPPLSFASAPPPLPQQRPAFSFGAGSTLPSTSPPCFFRRYTSKDTPPKVDKQQAETMDYLRLTHEALLPFMDNWT
uniref:Uncharacterized protein n=1 Tax=Kalanchoe fedtschenkoi TaxID=63787 RepID=A0A7N0UEU6_KALFE